MPSIASELPIISARRLSAPDTPCPPSALTDALSARLARMEEENAALRAALARHGTDTLVTALQCVTQTSDGNPGCLRRPVIEALCLVLSRSPRWRDAGGALFDAMDDFDFRAALVAARTAQIRDGGTVTGALARAVTAFLSDKLGNGDAA